MGIWAGPGSEEDREGEDREGEEGGGVSQTDFFFPVR